MIEIEVKQKTGFTVLENPVSILDHERRPFYNTLNLEVSKFNLPPGIYYLETGAINRRAFPVFYFTPFLPLGERFFYPNPKYFPIEYGSNPNKCSVLWDEKKILFDYSLKAFPKFLLNYIYFHELGHYYYDTEKYCDLFASNCMLYAGFNPSQILLAQNWGLSDNNQDRKDYVTNIMFNSNSHFS